MNPLGFLTIGGPQTGPRPCGMPRSGHWVRHKGSGWEAGYLVLGLPPTLTLLV